MCKQIIDWTIEIPGLGEFTKIEFFYEFDVNNFNLVYLAHVILSNEERSIKLTSQYVKLEKFKHQIDFATVQSQAALIFYWCKVIAHDQVKYIWFRNNQINEKLFSHIPLLNLPSSSN
jgi:wobble nucleotide-excising tRNase